MDLFTNQNNEIMNTSSTPGQGAAAAPSPVATTAATQNKNALQRMQEETVGKVLDKVQLMQEAGELVLPKDYHAGNALKSAWLYLQTIEDKNHNKALDACTNESIANCLLEMVIRGEHPKKHCYFIPCGKSLEFWERYTGKLMRTLRDTEVAKVNAQVIYDGDEFVYTVNEDGEYQLVSHTTNIANIDLTKIKGAYAVVIREDGSRFLEVMTIDQIRKAWQQGAAKGNSGAHVNFTDQMAKKTVIARACKIALDSSRDEDKDSEELRMTPPDADELERNQAQQQLQHIEPADYEEVTEQQESAGHEAAPSAPAPAAAKPRKSCPID